MNTIYVSTGLFVGTILGGWFMKRSVSEIFNAVWFSQSTVLMMYLLVVRPLQEKTK